MTFDDLLVQEIQRERDLVKRIRDLDQLDDLSKEMIRLRIYENQKQLINLNEFERA
ncbi:MAG: hypothetical protein GJ671_09525 [Alteromonadaceae bacterium]|nr:hypothetical protein [Alteromonadaceae bacterium]